MNWGEFKHFVEHSGVKDSHELEYIDWFGGERPVVTVNKIDIPKHSAQEEKIVIEGVTIE